MKRLTSLILVLLTFISFIAMPEINIASAKTLDELMQEKKELAEKISKKNEELAAIKDEVAKQELLLEQYEERLEEILEYMEIISALIEEYKIKLADAQAELDAKERDLKGFYEELGGRIRYLHMNNNASQLSIILGANSFSDAIVIGQVLTKIAESDTKLIDKVNVMRIEVENLRNGINRDLLDQETLMEEQEVLKEQATLLIQETHAELTYAQAEQWATQAAIDEYMLRLEQAQAEINQKMSLYSDEPYVGGNFKWPLPGFSRITSGYGWRTLYGQPNFHTGIDIAGSGVYGAPIIASNDGTVSTVVYGTYGYGYYVIIDHGGGYMTLYGHLSAIYVVEKEKIKQGNVVGAVGSTGNSTGPHLHFEIRLKGDKIDPMTIFVANG